MSKLYISFIFLLFMHVGSSALATATITCQDIFSQTETLTPYSNKRLKSLFHQARTLHKNGELAESYEIVSDILAHNPDHLYSLGLEIQIYLSWDQYDEALTRVEHLLSLDPTYFNYNLRAQALLGLGRAPEAHSSLLESLAINPDNDVTYALLGRVLTVMGDLPGANQAHNTRRTILGITFDWKKEAEALIRKRDYPAALKVIDRALLDTPNNPTVRFYKARTLSLMGRHREALILIDQLLASKPNHNTYLGVRTQILLRLGDSQSALETIRYRLTLTPNDPVALNLYTQALSREAQRIGGQQMRTQLLDAIDVLNQIPEPHPSILWMRARIHYTLGQMPEARTNVIQIIQTSEQVDPLALVALIRIQNTGTQQVDNALIRVLAAAVDTTTVEHLLNLDNHLFWDLSPTEAPNEVSIRNQFWEQLHTQAIDGQTYRSTR